MKRCGGEKKKKKIIAYKKDALYPKCCVPVTNDEDHLSMHRSSHLQGGSTRWECSDLPRDSQQVSVSELAKPEAGEACATEVFFFFYIP